jgi:insertion element IS1 protein InsB
LPYFYSSILFTSPLKNYCWIWIAADREAREYVDFVVGNRSTATGRKLWEKISDSAVGLVASDHWKSYNELISEEQLIQTKAETYTIESYNGQIRH